MTGQGNSRSVLLPALFIVFLLFTLPAQAYDVEFTVRGVLTLDEGRGMDCFPYNPVFLEYPFTLLFGLPVETWPDFTGPFGTDTYLIDGTGVKFMVGESIYPVTELELEIGVDYVKIVLEEFDGLRLEYIWIRSGLYSSGTLDSLCPIMGADTAISVSTYWNSYECFGYTTNTWFDIKCLLPGAEFPATLMEPVAVRHPAAVED